MLQVGVLCRMMTAYGASRPLTYAPAKVSSLNRLRSFSRGCRRGPELPQWRRPAVCNEAPGLPARSIRDDIDRMAGALVCAAPIRFVCKYS
jgi:hypothetical protein